MEKTRDFFFENEMMFYVENVINANQEIRIKRVNGK